MNSLMLHAPNAPFCRARRPGGDRRSEVASSYPWATSLILLVTALSGCASLARNRTDQGVVSARQLSLRGINAAQQGQLRDAEAYFSRASELCPLDERIRYHYAETLWQLGSHQEAVTHMEEAVRLSGGNAD